MKNFYFYAFGLTSPLVTLSLLISSTVLLGSVLAADVTHSQLEAAYQERLKEVKSAHQTELNRTNVRYFTLLEDLQKDFQRRGRLDGHQACENEKSRVDANKPIKMDVGANTPEELLALQQKYLIVLLKNNEAYAKAVLMESNTHLRQFNERVAELTKEGRIGDAKATRELILKSVADNDILIEAVSQAVAVESHGARYRYNHSARIFMYGQPCLELRPKQGLHVYTMRLDGVENEEPQWFNRFSINKLEAYMDKLSYGTIVLVAVEDYVHSSVQPQISKILAEVGSSQFDRYPKGGAYYCIGIKGLNPGKAVEGVDQNHLYYPNKAVVDDLVKQAAETAKIELVEKAEAAKVATAEAAKSRAQAATPGQFYDQRPRTPQGGFSGPETRQAPLLKNERLKNGFKK